MMTFETWLEQTGPQIAHLIDDRREPICDAVTNRLTTAFPSLCFDSSRPDAVEFQQHTFKETPRRFHRLIQVVLRFQTTLVIEREYRWGWAIMPRYGVARHHMISHARWYFDTVRLTGLLGRDDLAQLDQLAARVLQIIDQITAAAPPTLQRPEPPVISNGHRANGRMPRA